MALTIDKRDGNTGVQVDAVVVDRGKLKAEISYIEYSAPGDELVLKEMEILGGAVGGVLSAGMNLGKAALGED